MDVFGPFSRQDPSGVGSWSEYGTRSPGVLLLFLRVLGRTSSFGMLKRYYRFLVLFFHQNRLGPKPMLEDPPGLKTPEDLPVFGQTWRVCKAVDRNRHGGKNSEFTWTSSSLANWTRHDMSYDYNNIITIIV